MRTLATIVVIVVIVVLGAWALGWFDAEVVEEPVVIEGTEPVEPEVAEPEPEVEIEVEEVEELPETETETETTQ